MKKKGTQALLGLAVLVLSLIMVQFADENGDNPSPAARPPAAGEMLVHFIDVGQGDSTLLQGPDFTIVIDAGRHEGKEVVPYLQKAGVDTIDLLVGTHPHADHIGQMAQVINQFKVHEVWMSGDEHTSSTFERVIDAVADSGADYAEPRTGETYQIGSAFITILSPRELTGDLNAGSIAMRLDYGDTSFLFTGDAEAAQETAMLDSALPLQVDVLHLGHHGSSTSSTDRFLDATAPQWAVYSAGIDNTYGHPHAEVIARLNARKIKVYGTDTSGTIVLSSDGQSIRME